MDEKKRIEEEIKRLTELIKDSEKALENVPIHLRQSQEFVIGIFKKELDAFKQELAKFES